MTEQIALIGAGVMGFAIGARLLQCNHALTVYDRDPDKVAALIVNGAAGSKSASMAAENADFVILSLNTADIVNAAVFGENGVASGMQADRLIIDMSSIDPELTREFSGTAGQQGLRWLDCPLSGGVPKVEVGQLTVMAGGTLEDFETSKRVMDSLCSNYSYMGGSVAGQTTKLVNQVLGALNLLAVAEATQLAIDAGVDATKIPDALKGGRADSPIMQEYMPKMATGDYSPTGRLENMLKDLVSVQDLARKTGTSMPLTALCTEIHRLLVQAGHGDADNAALIEFFKKSSVGR